MLVLFSIYRVIQAFWIAIRAMNSDQYFLEIIQGTTCGQNTMEDLWLLQYYVFAEFIPSLIIIIILKPTEMKEKHLTDEIETSQELKQ